MPVFKRLKRTDTIHGKTITAKSVKDEALSIVETALARFDGMLAPRQYALAA